MRLREITALLVALSLWACGGDGPTDPDPQPNETTGSLVVTIQGLPAGTGAVVDMSGPGGFSRRLSASETIDELAPGLYSATVRGVDVAGLPYGTEQAVRYADVVAGQSVTIAVNYAALDLQIENFYITQSIQRFDRSIPLIAGRDGLLRVFARANILNEVRAAVRARIYIDGALAETIDIPASSFAAPTAVNEGALGTSWNATISGDLIQPGMAIELEIDPAGEVAEGDEGDNRFPTDGGRTAMTVQEVPVFDLVLVPVEQPNGTTGNVTEENKGSYVADLLRMFPIADYRVTVRRPFRASVALRPDSGWTAVLSELEGARVGDGRTGQYYYGVATIDYTQGIYGIAYRPGKTGLGNDYLDDRNLNASMTLAHELGHSMNRPHSQCGSAGFPDIEYPHANGQIGSFGFDLTTNRLFGPDVKDLMGYCEDRWIGDFTYEKVLEHRVNVEAGLGTSPGSPNTLVVWGRVEGGMVVLEPTFRAVTRPLLPEGRGPYRLEGFDAAGVRLFSYAFAGRLVEDGGRGDRIFAYALPVDLIGADRLAELRVTGTGVEVRRTAASGSLTVLRDRDSGEIVSLVRGDAADRGRAAALANVEAVTSDGLTGQ